MTTKQRLIQAGANAAKHVPPKEHDASLSDASLRSFEKPPEERMLAARRVLKMLPQNVSARSSCKLLGWGRDAVVFEGCSVALKIFSPSDLDLRRAERARDVERAWLCSLSHACIVPLLSFFDFQEGPSVHVLPLFWGDLLLAANRSEDGLGSPGADLVARDVLHGLAYLHARSLAHRDVKPENVLLSRWPLVMRPVNTTTLAAVPRGDCAKLTDFGHTVEVNSSGAVGCVGTRAYMAPEVLAGRNYGVACDVWSAGAALLSACLLECVGDRAETFEFAGRGAVLESVDVPLRLTASMKEMLESVLILDPDQRRSAEEAERRLCLRWPEVSGH